MSGPPLEVAELSNWDRVAAFLSTDGTKFLEHLLAAFVIVVIGRWVARGLSRICRSLMLRSKTDIAVATFVADLIYVTVLVFAVVSALGWVGFDTTSFAALIAAAGLAIGLALQGSLSNLASGLLLLVFKPFRVGDSVEIDTSAGTVEEIHVFSTLLRTADNVQIHIPNSKATQSVIKNYSAKEQRRIELLINCGYEDDLPNVKRVLDGLVRLEGRVLVDPEPSVSVNDFVPAGVQLAVRVWVKSADFADVRSALVERIKLGFDEHKFKLAYRP
ncbi:MAG TPA: mechanosensitive ion channel domain-containing protein [Planctomycetaceae bacterium]|jgi:small conductance mechanosensitive channel|nr:mechanosensitive ion channel domain-containing protein [Planctomycetaceae bacterium]